LNRGARYVQIMAIPASFSPLFSLLRFRARRGIFFEIFVITLLITMPQFLNAGAGIASINSRAVCNTFLSHERCRRAGILVSG
jgi:hypothetical protein